MRIRSLTAFLDPGWPVRPERIDAISDCLMEARDALANADYDVKSLNLATPPPSEMSRRVPPDERPEFAQQLEAQCFIHGLDSAAVGPATPDEPEAFAFLPEILGAAERIHTSAIIADQATGLSLRAARACAEAIEAAAGLGGDGMANLRFAALANVPPGVPFMPGAYDTGGSFSLAIAAEAAELAFDALRDVATPDKARRRLVSMIEGHATGLTRKVEPVAEKHQVRFAGIDFSLAPYPDQVRSVGAALESVGVPRVGLPGTLAAAAFLADCLDGAEFKRTGLCALVLPVLEDSILAQRSGDELINVGQLMLYSAVSGSGLDAVPLPGDCGAEALCAVLLDVGALALRLNKPLTARLVPIPGAAAGDPVELEPGGSVPGRVLALPSAPLTGLLGGSSTFDIRPLMR